MVVREGTEGPYTGNGGALRVGTPHEIATEVSVNTAYGVERVVRDAFARAQRRPRKKLTLVHKTNVLVNAGSLWWRLVQAVAPEFPDVTVDYIHVDAAMIFLTTDPSAVRRDRHRQPVRRHHHRPRRRHHRRHRAGRLRQRQPGPHRPEHVRARARLGPRHRRPAEGRPDRGDPVRVAAARPPRVRRRGGRRRARGRRRPGGPSTRGGPPYRRGRRRDRVAPSPRSSGSAGRQRLDPVEHQRQPELELGPREARPGRPPSSSSAPAASTWRQTRQRRRRSTSSAELVGPVRRCLGVGELEPQQQRGCRTKPSTTSRAEAACCSVSPDRSMICIPASVQASRFGAHRG